MQEEKLEEAISKLQAKISTALELNTQSTQLLHAASKEAEALYLALPDLEVKVVKGGKASKPRSNHAPRMK